MMLAALVATTAGAWAEQPDDDDDAKPVITEIVVTASRLDIARANLEPSLGATAYMLSNEAVESRPGSETVSIGEVLLQAPGVVQAGSGQLRVRAQGDLEYRINNIILPGAFADLGESLSARLADRIQLVTGALPAQYGLHAGGVVNITTKSGAYQDGGQAELYGGSHNKFEPAFEYAWASGRTNVFVSGSYLADDVGLNAPNGTADPRHDRTDQFDSFAFIDHIVDDETRLSLILGSSIERFQLPYQGVGDSLAAAPFQPPLSVRGFTAGLPPDGSQRQDIHYGIASFQRSTEKLTLQASAFARYATLSVAPDRLRDLAYSGLGRSVANTDLAAGVQIEASYRLTEAHTLRGGTVASSDREKSLTNALVLAVDAQGRPISLLPDSIAARSSETAKQAGLFLQDEWRPVDQLTVNFGLRFDDAGTRSNGNALSPRLNTVWTVASGVSAHAGYARYFIPRPLNEVSVPAESLAGTSGALPSPQGDATRSETDDYYDVGIQEKGDALTVGLDGYWRDATNLIDEALIGPAALHQAFNYRAGRIRGIELSLTYARGPFSAWTNLAYAEAEGRGLVSNQALFDPAALAAIGSRFVRTDHDQPYTASAGASYQQGPLRFSGDLIYGTGLPRTTVGGLPNGGRLPGYVQVNLAAMYRTDGLGGEPLDVRLDLINAFDRRYEITDGTAVGSGVPQWGPRRGIFAGIEQSF